MIAYVLQVHIKVIIGNNDFWWALKLHFEKIATTHTGRSAS